MKKLPKVAVLILHFGNVQLTLECLDALSKISKKNFALYTIVIDNSLKTESSQIKLHNVVDSFLIPSINLGFAAGNNFAAKKALKEKCDYLLLLNNDTVVEVNFLDNLIDQIHDYDILGPILDHKVKHQIYYDYGGYIDWKKSQPKHINLDVDHKILDQQKHSSIELKAFNKQLKQKVIARDFVSGCCMLINSNTYQKIGGLDENFFMYLEDVDLCLKAKLINLKVGLVTNSHIFHKGSQSSTEWLKIRYSLINSLRINWRYNKLKYKFYAILWLLYFYPTLFMFWQLKKIKKSLLS